MKNTIRGQTNFQLKKVNGEVVLMSSDGANTVAREALSDGCTYSPVGVAVADEVIALFDGKTLKRKRYQLIIE